MKISCAYVKSIYLDDMIIRTAIGLTNLNCYYYVKYTFSWELILFKANKLLALTLTTAKKLRGFSIQRRVL